MRIRGRLLACAVAGSAAITLAGCTSPGARGGNSAAAPRSAATLITQMKAAVGAATSMHLAGQLPDDGRPVVLDLGVIRAGGLTGTITENGLPLRLIDSRGTVYVLATPAFLQELRAAAGVCALLCGKYVRIAGQQAAQLAGSLSMTSLIRSLIATLPRFRETGTTMVGDRAALVLRGTNGSTLDVAARGEPYPLKEVAAAGQDEEVVFTRWDSVPVPAAPPASEVINLSQLRAGTG